MQVNCRYIIPARSIGMIASTEVEAVDGKDGFYLADMAGEKKTWMGISILAGNAFASNGTTRTICSWKAKGYFWVLYFRFTAPDFCPGVKIFFINLPMGTCNPRTNQQIEFFLSYFIIFSNRRECSDRFLYSFLWINHHCWQCVMCAACGRKYYIR